MIKKKEGEKYPHIPTKLSGSGDHLYNDPNARKHERIAHRSIPVLRSLHLVGMPLEPI